MSLKGKKRLKDQIGQALIDIMLKRTANGKDVSGNNFKKYSKSYTESAAFEQYGKSKSKVDMELKGDMMEDLDIIKTTGDSQTYGFTDELSKKKAANHNQAITLPLRQFFGVTKSEINKVKRSFANDLKKVKNDIKKRETKKEEVPTLAELLNQGAGAAQLNKLIDEIINGQS